MLLKLFIVLLACVMLSSLQSCSQLDVKRMTYSALRQHDCRVNDPNAFCDRTFANEYLEYERIRNDFLRDVQPQNASSESGLILDGNTAI